MHESIKLSLDQIYEFEKKQINSPAKSKTIFFAKKLLESMEYDVRDIEILDNTDELILIRWKISEVLVNCKIMPTYFTLEVYQKNLAFRGPLVNEEDLKYSKIKELLYNKIFPLSLC